ncbi:MAG: hypothetical protein ACOX44_05860 [Limnochordia bacterium]|jgi:hypothetical protein
MKRFALVLTLVAALVFSTFSVSTALSKSRIDVKNPGGVGGGVTTCSGPFLPGGSWEEN